MRGTGREFLYYSAFLIGTYLVVKYAKGVSSLLISAGDAASGYARTLQGN